MKRLLPFLLTLAFVPPQITATTLTFEDFPDSTILTNQYPGVTFANTVILTAGISLNEFEFPPRSGVNVASDKGGPITISFATAINNFSGYFTYAQPLTIDAFNSANKLLATKASLFSNNEALSGVAGSSPNEFDSLSSLSGISSITITGSPLGGSFALSDMSYSETAAVPEPSGLVLTLSVLAIVISCLAKTRIMESRSLHPSLDLDLND